MNQQDKDNQRAAFEAWARKNDYLIHRSPNDEGRYERGFTQDVWEVWQAALASPEVQALRDALERCRFALEPYDDVKPRDWKSDRENLRYAHQAVCAALAAMGGGNGSF